MNSYELKQAARKERYQNKAENLNQKAHVLHDAGMKALKAIPFGQPVMPDHHSYKSDISYRRRAVGKIEKSFEISNKADHYEQKAESVGTGGVSSDDPDAISKLETKLLELQETHQKMKDLNAEARNNGTEKPCPTWMLSNSNANIRNVQQRIEDLEAKKTMVAKEVVTPLYTMKEDLEDNRILFIFEGKPSDEIRSILKSSGFKWSPSRTAWVRQLTQNAQHSTRRAMMKLNELN
jgi:hypothetical protein